MPPTRLSSAKHVGPRVGSKAFALLRWLWRNRNIFYARETDSRPNWRKMQASGQLERLLRSGARFAAKAMVLSAASDDAAIKTLQTSVRKVSAILNHRPTLLNMLFDQGMHPPYKIDLIRKMEGPCLPANQAALRCRLSRP